MKVAELDTHEMARKLANDLLHVGDEHGETPHRIEFKLGEWPDNEKAAGGMCEVALAEFFEARIADYIRSVYGEEVG